MSYRFVAFVFIVSITCVTAQERQDYSPPGHGYAIQFGIGNNFTLSDFQGSMMSIKRHTSTTSAWRFGLGFSGEIGTMKRTSAYGVPDSSDTFGEGDIESSNVVLTLLHVSYLANERDIHLYLGYGPAVSFGHSLSDPKPVDQAYRYGSYYHSESHSFSAGASGIVGVEWFFKEDMSLHAEYDAFAGYVSQRTKYSHATDRNGNYSLEENEAEKIVCRSNGVRFGLSVYL